jgi:hypothetical protein
MTRAKRPPEARLRSEGRKDLGRRSGNHRTAESTLFNGIRQSIPYDDQTASARRLDSETSREAAAAIPRDVLNAGQRVVLNAFKLARRPLTDEELIAEVGRHFPQTRLTDSSIRTRRRELERRGRIVFAGFGTTARGRRCRRFELAGRR